MTQTKVEILWGAAIVIGTGASLLLGLSEAGAFVVTMALVAVALVHINKAFGLGTDRAN